HRPRSALSPEDNSRTPEQSRNSNESRSRCQTGELRSGSPAPLTRTIHGGDAAPVGPARRPALTGGAAPAPAGARWVGGGQGAPGSERLPNGPVSFACL